MFNHFLASSSFFGLFLAGRALAGIYTTNPVADTVTQAGQTLTINWVDDGVYPLLGNIGPCSIALYTGSTFEQTWLASIAEEIDVSKVGTINWAVDPNVGPAGNYYFIRYTSKNLKDSGEGAYPHTAYSAKFTLENMSGSFNGTILSQINATSSVPPSGASATSSMNATSAADGAASTGASQAISSGSNATSSAGSMKSSATGMMSSSVTLTRSSPSGSVARPTSASATSDAVQSATESSDSTNSAAALGRELSHAGIGAVVLGCMGLGLALCL